MSDWFYLAPFAVLWLSWLGYWIVGAQNTKTTLRRETHASRVSHVLLTFFAAVLLLFAISRRIGSMSASFLKRW